MKKNTLNLFLLIHFLIWVFIPLIRPNIPMDSAEALVWGGEWQFGTNKHPFLSGWIIELIYQIINHLDITIYFTSQLCVIIGLIYIYRLARHFVSNEKAVLCALFLEGSVYYSICSVEYNVNVLSLSLVPMMIYYFYQSLQTHKTLYWCLTGFLAGLCMVTKYTNGLFLLCMGLCLLSTPQGRSEFKKAGLYIAALIGAGICLPHLIWLYTHDFYTLDYYLGRSAPKHDFGIFNHLIFPIKFLGAQAAAVLGSIILCVCYFIKSAYKSAVQFQKPNPFLLYVGLLPLIVLTVLSLLFAIPLKSMWGFAVMSYIPLMLFDCVRVKESTQANKFGVFLSYAALFCMAGAFLISWFYSPSFRTHFNGKKFASEMASYWESSQHTPLQYVGGDIWFASNISLNTTNRPRVMINMNPVHVPWINEQDVLQKGCLVVTNDKKAYEEYLAKYPHLEKPHAKENIVRSPIGKKRSQTIYYGILPAAKGL